MNKRLLRVFPYFLIILFLSTTVSFAVSPTIDTFDGGNIGDWRGNTISTTVMGEAMGGNPGGFLSSQATANSTVGALNEDEPFIGNYIAANIGFMSVDLKFFQTIFNPRLRVRRASNENGWHYVFTPIGNQSNQWQHFSVEFNPAWSDQEAMDNGWVQEGGTGSFVEVWSSVVDFEIRADGASPDAQALGIDNVRIAEGASQVPTLSQWGYIGLALILGAIGFIAIRKRKLTA